MSGDNSIPNGWVETTLGEVIKLVGGGTPKTSINEYWNGSIPWLSVVDFNDDNRWVSNAEKSITELGLKKSSTKLLNIGDIIISARGTVGAMAQLKKEMAFNQSCYGIKEIENVSDKDFLFYLVKYSLKQINRNSYGAVFDTITTKTFDVININLPPLPEQVAIAKILTAFDDKIELLQAQNKTLETIAQTLFKEWFGKYQIGDVLPERWKVRKIGDIAFNHSKSFKFTDDKVVFINTGDVLKGQFLHSNECIPKGLPGQAKKAIELYDILYSEIRPKNKRFAFVDFPTPNYVVSTKFMVIRPLNDFSPFLLYFILKSKETIDEFNVVAESRSGTFPQITFDSIKNYAFVLPSTEIQLKFEKTLKIIMSKQKNNSTQIQTLKQTRDTLLPKLMSGQLRVDAFKEGSLC